MKTVIVITNTEDEVKFLKPDLNNIGFGGRPIQNYNTEWYWTIKGKDISGMSGYNSLKQSIYNEPDARIYSFNQYKNSHAKQSEKNY